MRLTSFFALFEDAGEEPLLESNDPRARRL